jgi:hypothetical protein
LAVDPDVTVGTPDFDPSFSFHLVGETGPQGFQGPQGFTTLDGATDVTITSPSTGQALVYDGTSSQWVNTTASTDPMNDSKFTAIITMDVGV